MRRYFSALYIILAVVLIVLFGLLGGLPLTARWFLIMATFIGLLVLLGRDITGTEREVRLRSGRTETRFVPGRIDGVLIDSRHKVSLSRLQLVLWTVVVLSAWATLALHRTLPVLQGQVAAANAPLVDQIAGLLAGEETAGAAHTARAEAVLQQLGGAADGDAPAAYSPLDIAIPQEVLLALGISIASLAGAGFIKTNQATNEDGRAQEIAAAKTVKATQRAAAIDSTVQGLESLAAGGLEAMLPGGLESMDGDPQATEAALAAAQARLARIEAELQAAEAAAEKARERAARLAEAQAESVGDLHAKGSFADARWSDMLRGDTVANFEFTDLGKVQMFFFTVILVFAYAALIWSIMSMPMAGAVLQRVPSLSLPAFSDSLVITLALSHGGYLATKTAV